MRRFLRVDILIIALLIASVGAVASPKREFRGAWIQTVFQDQYARRTPHQNREALAELVDSLASYGINAIFFQVRPSADAFYKSSIEPWSVFLVGQKGGAPGWDPLQLMIDLCHNRGIELHAWINPYRITASASQSLPGCIRSSQTVTYGRRQYFNPALPENRTHIARVVADILRHYDVDGIHFDDYFYPYPIKGQQFDDDAQYRAAKTDISKADWRRRNVDLLIEQVHDTIQALRPWVRFGVSPFGIWRNKSSDPAGSETRGLQNYDDLYADVPLWARRGWIDYQIPQLYWELDHPNASYRTLCRWWAQQGGGRHVYIGQDVKKTDAASELTQKISLIDSSDNLQGSCWWYAANLGLLGPMLRRTHYSAPALVPEYIWKHTSPADKPSRPTYDNRVIRWDSGTNARKWVVYRFDAPDEIDIESPNAIAAVTYWPEFHPQSPGCYVVTALDHANGESAPSLPLELYHL